MKMVDRKVEVILGFSDGTKVARIEELADVTDFLERHEEYVKVVRCKDCRHYYANMIPGGRGCQRNVYMEVGDNFFCANGARMDEVDK